MNTLLNEKLANLNAYAFKQSKEYIEISDRLIQVLAQYDLNIPDVVQIINYTLYEVVNAPIQKDSLKAYLAARSIDV